MLQILQRKRIKKKKSAKSRSTYLLYKISYYQVLTWWLKTCLCICWLQLPPPPSAQAPAPLPQIFSIIQLMMKMKASIWILMLCRLHQLWPMDHRHLCKIYLLLACLSHLWQWMDLNPFIIRLLIWYLSSILEEECIRIKTTTRCSILSSSCNLPP